MENRGKPLPEHLVRQIRQLRRAGRSIREIAELVGVSTTTVQKHLRGPWETLGRQGSQPLQNDTLSQ